MTALLAKIHLKGRLVGNHTEITVFCNGANCGQLMMTEEEAIYFHQVVMLSTYSKEGEVISSGIWTKEVRDEFSSD